MKEAIEEFLQACKELYKEAMYLYQYYPRNGDMVPELYFYNFADQIAKIEKLLKEEKDGEA